MIKLQEQDIETALEGFETFTKTQSKVRFQRRLRRAKTIRASQLQLVMLEAVISGSSENFHVMSTSSSPMLRSAQC